jgi:hypothetical protein
MTLPAILLDWKSLAASGIKVQLKSIDVGLQEGHLIRKLQVILVNNTNEEIRTYSCLLSVPAIILTHGSVSYSAETRCDQPGRRCFRFGEKEFGSILPHDHKPLYVIDYCTWCAANEGGGGVAANVAVAAAIVEAKILIENRKYSTTTAIKELAGEA